MLIVVGNSPSSGSTFLGDLLDSTPLTICGGELGLFSSCRMFEEKYPGSDNMASFADWFRSPISSVYLYYSYLSREQLAHYGMSYTDFMGLYRRFWLNNDLAGFVEGVRGAFADYRGLKGREIFCEKTPQNIACAKQLLQAMDDAVFVHVVRNPAHVYVSLIRRGFSPSIAAATWLADVTAIMALESHPRVRVVRYEDLVDSPFSVVSALLKSLVGEAIPEDEIRRLYEVNNYRENSHKVSSWSINQYGIMGNANRKKFSDFDRGVLAWSSKCKIESSYRRLKGLADASMRDALDHYGYLKEYEEICGDVRERTPNISFRGAVAAVRKWRFDCSSEKDVANIAGYFMPLREGY